MRRLSSPSFRPTDRTAFTLVELLVVILIVSIIAAVTLPVVIPAISHRQVGESARIIQAALVGARDASLRTNTPHGIRFLPDPTYNGLNPGSLTAINPYKILASNRFVPIEQPPGYSEGRVFIDNQFNTVSGVKVREYADTITPNRRGFFVNYPPLASRANSGLLYGSGRLLMVVQAPLRRVQGTTRPQLEAPTSWYWNVRAGDKIQINNVGPYFTVVGPVNLDTPEKFVNVDPSTTTLRLLDYEGRFGPTDGDIPFPYEYLFVVNGEDDDGDGYVDNGWDGVDNDLSGVKDDVGEWSEIEAWPSAYASTITSESVVGSVYQGVPYNIVRRPVPSPGARETVLPGNVVVDLTSALMPTPERSRLPVDDLSGNVDIMVDPGGRMVPTTRYSAPTSFGLVDSFYHIWVGERSDLAEVVTTGSGTSIAAAPLVNSYPFLLPMPLGQNAGVDPTNAYDQLVNTNPNLPYLKGQIRLLTLSTRTGNMITTDSPTFDVRNVNQPYRAAQMGQQGETP